MLGVMRRAMLWAATVPAFLAGIALGVLATLASLELLDRLCPPAAMVSGLCTAAWYPAAQTAALSLGAALAAVSSLLGVFWVCPGREPRTVTVAWAVGAVYATGAWIEIGASFTGPALAALGCGAWIVARVRRQHRG